MKNQILAACRWGFVLESTDSGATFQDITSYDTNGDSNFPDVSRCQIVGDTLVVAGEGGFFAVLPSE